MPAPNLKLVPPPDTERVRLVREHAALLGEMLHLRETQARLLAAKDDGASIEAELSAIVTAEAAELREWAETGAGDPPSPHMEKRTKIGRRLAAANDRARALGVATADVEARTADLAQSIAAKAALIEGVVLAELARDGRELIALEEAQTRELQETTTRLDALRFWLRENARSHFDKGDHDQGRLYADTVTSLERTVPIEPATQGALFAAARLWQARGAQLATVPEAGHGV